MLPRLSSIVILILLTTSCLTVEAAKRRSRIDSPILNPADAPPEDNLATASGSDVIVEKLVEAPPQTTVQAEEIEDDVTAVSESNSSEESPAYDDCDVDNISFELITG